MNNEPRIQVDHDTLQKKILLALLLLFFLVVVVRNAWLSDDALITLRTVRNFNEGYGLVWNIHERVQAYTHPLWMMLLSLTYFITNETFFSTLAVSIGLSFATASLISLKIARTSTVGLLALLLLTLSKAFIDYTTSGLENPLSYFLLTLFFYLYIQDNRERSSSLFWLTFIAALGVTNRTDSALIFAPALLYSYYNYLERFRTTSRKTEMGQKSSIDRLQIRRLFWSILCGGLPFLAWTLFSIVYYGFPFPNTAYAKLSADVGNWEKYHQGFYYLLNSLSVDPITLIVIGIAVAFTIVIRDQRLRFLMLGVVLYIVYVLYIGGDFMSGRFFSVPFLGAVLVLSQQNSLSLNAPRTYILFLGFTVIGLLNPPQSPILSNEIYNWNALSHSGIADERGHYYGRYGLLSTNRENRLEEQGYLRGTESPENFLHCGIGYRGFMASHQTIIIDECGLADAFIARLPSTYAPNWRVGHPLRSVPPDYLGTLRTGKNQFQDPNLALFYEKLAIVTQGEIWSAERFGEIWRFNRGFYDHLLDEEKLRFPLIVELSIEPGSDNGTDGNRLIDTQLFFANDFEIELNAQGVRLHLDTIRHPTHLDIGLNSAYFEIVYFLDDEEIGRQTITTAPLSLGGRKYSVAAVPPLLTAQGFNSIRISPRLDGDYEFTYISLSNLDSLGLSDNKIHSSPSEVREALQLYYHIFYRETAPQMARTEREVHLSQLLSRLQLTAAEDWTNLPQSMLFDLLTMPDPALHAIVFPHLQNNLPLVNSNGESQMRYIGYNQPQASVTDEESSLPLTLYFLVDTPIEKEYSAWFGIKQSKDLSDDEVKEWMLYDHFPQIPTTQWGMGTIVKFETRILLEPDEYELTFGLWSAERERLYVDIENDVYWIDLGKFEIEEMSEIP